MAAEAASAGRAEAEPVLSRPTCGDGNTATHQEKCSQLVASPPPLKLSFSETFLPQEQGDLFLRQRP